MTAPRTTPSPAPAPADAPAGPALDVVIPVRDEAAGLVAAVRRVHAYLRELPFTARITIADNASTDGTFALARTLAGELDGVRAVHLGLAGRGRALRAVWSGSDAEVLVYMDVDLSTDLAALHPLVAPLLSGHSDLAVGTRLAPGARVVRGPRRELVSRCYNLLLHGTLATGFSDAQCGFKAIRADVARRLLPLVEDTGWFFDTELLVLAERAGLRIHQVPVDWTDDPDSRVDLVATAVADLRGIARLARALATGRLPVRELRARLGRAPLPDPAGRGATSGVPPGLLHRLVRFCAVGAVSTVAYLILFTVLRDGLPAQVANLVALLITAVANTAVNRRLTFGVRGRLDAGRHQLQGLLVFALGLGLTGGSLALLTTLTAPSRALEAAVLVAANLVATLLRFTLLRGWVFRTGRRPARPTRTAPKDVTP